MENEVNLAAISKGIESVERPLALPRRIDTVEPCSHQLLDRRMGSQAIEIPHGDVGLAIGQHFRPDFPCPF